MLLIYLSSQHRGRLHLSDKYNEDLQVGSGYWILVYEDQNYVITGQPIQSYSRTLYNNGWEMIGGCTSDAKALVDNGNIDVIYRFDKEMGYKRVQQRENLQPGQGYWILITEISDQCKLTVEDVSLNGAWFWHGSQGSEEYNQYFIVDEKGVFKDFGAFCFESGTYELLPDSSFIFTIIEPVQYCDGKTHVVKGKLTSSTEGFTIFNDEIRYMEKISNLSICEGT